MGGFILKKAIVLLAEGFEDIEALTPVDILRRGKLSCTICSVDDKNEKTSSRGTTVKTDEILKNINIDEYDAVILPGGLPGATNLRDNDNVIKLVSAFNKNGKLVAAICAAPIVLDKAGIIKNKNVTSNPNFKDELKEVNYKEDFVVQDGNIITSRGAATSIYFAFKILENLSDEETVERVKRSTLMNLVDQYHEK
jgi:4-methyl-5(b-hydroxyethyl)-thiazole monophosphate biosynthesis